MKRVSKVSRQRRKVVKVRLCLRCRHNLDRNRRQRRNEWSMKNKAYPLYEVKQISTLKELIDFRAEESPGTTAFAWTASGKKYEKTYKELKQEIVALEASLHRRNVRNTKIAILGENSYEWILAFFAAVCSGSTAVPVDKELSPEAVIRLVEDSGCTHLIFSDTYRDVAEAVCGAAGICAINMNEFDALISEGTALPDSGTADDADIPVLPETLAAVIYTSGTTGISKGVMLSHGNLALDTCSACRNCKFFGDTMLLLPLHHSFGLVAGVFVIMLYGYTIYINRSLKSISRDLTTAKPQSLFVVPLFVESLYKQVWNTAEQKGKADALRFLVRVSNLFLKLGIDLRRKLFRSVLEAFGGNLDTIVSGGAPLNRKYIQGFRDFGINLLNGYGITECSPVVSVNRNEHYRDGSVGQVLNACTVRIDAADQNGVGEVCVQGAIVMQGYYGRKEETDEAVVEGWFHTGDLGYMDSDGFLFITGRKKNLIILSNGENVAPEELEGLFDDIPLVKEIVVYEKEHRIIAEIYPDEEYAKKHSVTSVEEELNQALTKINKTLPRFKQISSIIVRRSEFEKTTTKKIKRDTVGGNRNV